MAYTETPKHLFQPPKFESGNRFFNEFNQALNRTGNGLTLDIGAIQSYLSFGYICGDRTILEEVKRQPWLSSIENNQVELQEVPDHDFYSHDYDVLGDVFFKLLLDEARSVIKDHDQIYILLSGGLDSRIVAGVLKWLYDNGELKSMPKAVTWGLPDSRDVVYGQKIADKLGFEWFHVPLTPETVLENIHVTAKELGLMHSPEMLHNMYWFRNLPENSLVLAGSFGDSIGRGEFMGLHLLQLKHPNPIDKFELLKYQSRIKGQEIVENDIKRLFKRKPNALSYMHYEHFMQGFRMRGGLCSALTVINGNAKVYQMFTHPRVYEFIWSLHPSVRGDEMYIETIGKYIPELAKFPWARTNKSLNGKTIGAMKDLRPNYHEYTKWTKYELKNELDLLIDIEWFEEMGLFNIESLKKLKNVVYNSEARVGRANDVWLWLAGFRVFADYLNDSGKTVSFDTYNRPAIKKNAKRSTEPLKDYFFQKILNKSTAINSLSRKVRTYFRGIHAKRLKQQYLTKYPTVKLKKDDLNDIINKNE